MKMSSFHASVRTRRTVQTAALASIALLATTARADFDVSKLARYEGFLVTGVTITGHSVTREYVIRREIRTQAGKEFRVALAAADLTRLENLGIFSSQVIQVVPNDSSVALTYQVREMPWIVPYPKFKYTEQDSWSIGAGVASVNMLGRAIYLGGSGTVGGVDAFSALFQYPWITGNHISIDAFLSDDRRHDTLNEFQEHSREITPWFGRYIRDNGRLAGTISWFQMNADRDGITISPDRRDDYLRYGIKGGFDNRDSWRNPTSGWNNELLIMWYDGFAFDEHSWPLVELDLRRYQPLGNRRNTLIIGGLFSWQDGQAGAEIPGYLQYRMGGANSIRGHDIEVLGKELVGRNQLILTLEYQRAVIPIREFRFMKWSVSGGLDIAGFYDAGDAWNLAEELNTRNVRQGVGVGLRFLVPSVYEIRTDVAIGEDGDVHFHLGVGDKLSAQRARLR
jgi:outer membrane protein assembly factor BamA